MKGPFLLVFMLVLLLSTAVMSIEFKSEPVDSDVFEANPTIHFDVGEHAINTFLYQNVDLEIGYEANILKNVPDACITNPGPLGAFNDVIDVWGDGTFKIKVLALNVDFEKNSAQFTLGLKVTYDLDGTEQNEYISFTKSLAADDIIFDIGLQKIKVVINKGNDFATYLEDTYAHLPGEILTVLEKRFSGIYLYRYDVAKILQENMPAVSFKSLSSEIQEIITIGLEKIDNHLEEQLKDFSYFVHTSDQFTLLDSEIQNKIKLIFATESDFTSTQFIQFLSSNQNLTPKVQQYYDEYKNMIVDFSDEQVKAFYDFVDGSLADFKKLPSHLKAYLDEKIDVNDAIDIRRARMTEVVQFIHELGAAQLIEDAPIFWPNKDITLHASFEDDYVRFSVTPHLETEKPHFELWEKIENNVRTIRIVTNSRYDVENFKLLTLRPMVGSFPPSLVMKSIKEYPDFTIDLKDENSRSSRYYYDIQVNYDLHEWNGIPFSEIDEGDPKVWWFAGLFTNEKQMILVRFGYLPVYEETGWYEVDYKKIGNENKTGPRVFDQNDHWQN